MINFGWNKNRTRKECICYECYFDERKQNNEVTGYYEEKYINII